MADESGSVADETARLLDALLGVQGSGRRAADETSGTGTHTGGNTHTGGSTHTEEHSALGSDTDVCRVCPVCQALRIVRAVQPETLDRLADLAAAVTETLRDAAAARRRESGAPTPAPPRAPVEDIAVSDEAGGWW